MDFTVKTSTGEYDLEAYVRFIGLDLLVAIWGGEKPHIGAVSVAQPRPSLRDPDMISSSASVFCLVGHKEEELAKATAEILAATLDTNVTVTAGIHWDDIVPAGIEKVIQNSVVLVEMILDKIVAKHPSTEEIDDC
jgi:hypothetical protein